VDIGRWLIVVGLTIALTGVLIMALGGRLPLGHLPGDVVIHRGNVTIWLPLATSIVLSAGLTLGWWLLAWLSGRR
jgi:hypothetical protein